MAHPFIPVAEPDLGPLEEQYLLEAVRSGWVSSIGAFIDRFEGGFAKYCGTRHAIMVSNGTVALHLALVAKGIGPGDEVIVPDLTFVATASAVRHAGATPVLVDVDPANYNLDPSLVEQAITSRTKAVIVAHLFGHPADMTALREICARRRLFLVEDAAEAHGARWAGKPVGGLGDVGTFSFYGNKVLTTGEGGAITTNDDTLAARMRYLKDHAMSKERRYYHAEVGYNYRMTNVQAALGLAQLERAKEILERKARVLGWYREALADTDIQLNPVKAPGEPICWLVTALLPDGVVAAEREALQKELLAAGIDSRPFFIPLSNLPPYAEFRMVRGSRHVAVELYERGMCLPSSTKLAREAVDRIARVLKKNIADARL